MIKCNVCQIEKEENNFQKYWHSTQQKMRIRKQCTECLYRIRLKRKNPDKYFQDNPNYHKCITCSQWKIIETEFYHRNGKPYLNRCKVCELNIERTKRKEYLLENCGSDRVPPKPNEYTDEYQKACTFELLETLGYLYDTTTGIWIKPGYKEIKNGKPFFPTVKGIPKQRNKIAPTKFEKIVILREQGYSYEKIAEELNISDTSVYKYMKKWKNNQLK